MITGTGNAICDGDYDEYLDSLIDTDEPVERCPYCLEEHCPGEPECEAPEIDEDLND